MKITLINPSLFEKALRWDRGAGEKGNGEPHTVRQCGEVL